MAATARAQGLRGEDTFDVVQDAFVTFPKVAHARRLSEEVADCRALLGVLVRNRSRRTRASSLDATSPRSGECTTDS